jgi:regulator of replication initiation timing
MLIGYLKEKNSSEKELIDRISSLEKTIEILEKEKNNKWKNLSIVVKDNRVLKKQNNKLIKMLNS